VIPIVKEGSTPMQLPIPEPLKAEHEALHAELARARDAGGQLPSLPGPPFSQA